MPKKSLLILIIVSTAIAVWSTVFNPRLYLQGFQSLIHNRVDVYKINKGLHIYRSRPLMIPGILPETKEKIDFENRKVIISTIVGTFKIHPDVAMPFDSYFARMQARVFKQSLLTQTRTPSQQTQTQRSGLISEITIDLPSIAIPRAVRRVLGSKAGRLNLDGTQKMTLQAASIKRKRVPIYDTTGGNTFDLKLEQETNLRLTGTIGEKIAVNMNYNSSQDEQFFDPNNINVKYTGDEDEIIQKIEAGNITLSLGGSRYISYSTSSQGLFGITSNLKYGDLDITMIASKEEGQKNTQTYLGLSLADSTIFRSKDFTARTMYFLTDPYDLLALYTDDDIGNLVPLGWINNAIKTSPAGEWLIRSPNLLPGNGTVRLYLDDANASNNVTAAPGDTIFFSASDFYVPFYDELIEGTDFVTDYSSGTITILRAIDRRTTLAVRYIQQDGTPVPINSNIQDGILHAKVIRRRNQEYDPTDTNNVWHYQMRNIYNMNRTNIKSEGFSIQVYTENTDRTRNYTLPDSLLVPGMSTYNDYLRLDSNGDGIINGDDTTINLANGYIYFPFLEPFRPLGDQTVYQIENEYVSYLDIAMFIGIKGKIGRDAIDLGQGGILKGSVKVKVNGQNQRENIDYIVDYDMGRITFLTAAGKDPDARIEIDYEFRSLFSVASKTMAGIRANWNITENTKLGGTFIYRSENVSDRRPKVGNENIELIMADIDGSITIKPKFLTRWIDALPLIDTSTESRLSLSGEIAWTIPNLYGDPNGKKDFAYVDDMEAIVNQYPMGVTYTTWVLGSKPWGTAYARGRTIWYNPKNIKREQIEDPNTLTEREKKELVTVLALKVFPSNLGLPGSNVLSWGGVMKYLGNQLDFSTMKYIELLVKVEGHPGEMPPNPILHVDLGDINEDFYTEFGGMGVLNTEDKNHDGVLTLDEDNGLDGIPWGQPGHDPNDRASNDTDQHGDYPWINGTEANRILDTEDLDGNGVLNQLDRYLSYSIALNDSLYLENVNHNGWKLYRIPLNDPNAFVMVNNSTTGVLPALNKISYGRIWIETDHPTKVLIATADIVGNKWLDFLIRFDNDLPVPASQLSLLGSSYLSGVANNQKNRTHYTSPPGTVYIEDRRESSESALTLSLTNLQAGHKCLLRQRLFDPYNLLSYDKLKIWVYPELADGIHHQADELWVVMRLGADSLNYYQIQQKVNVIPYLSKMDRDRWLEFTYDMSDLTTLKEINPGADSGEMQIGDTIYSYKRNPMLTNIREIYFGVFNPDQNVSNPRQFNGTLYFNDIRVVAPFEDIGIARRLTFNAVLADFITFDADYEHKSENFNPTIQRGRVNTFTENTSLTLNNKYFLHKFFPASWGLDIPLNLNRAFSIGTPRFRANSDLLRANITDPAEKERERTENLIYAADFGFSQRNTPKNRWLLYTINRMAFSGRIEHANRRTPTAIDTTLTWRGTLNYNLSFPSDQVSVPLFGRYRIGFFPSSWSNSFTLNTGLPRSYNWERRDNVFGWYPRAYSINTKQLSTDNNINWGITSDLTGLIKYTTKRDLLQKDYLHNINIGKETEFVQDLGLNYNPTFFPNFITFSSSAGARFSENQRKYVQTTNDGPVDVYQSDGNTNRSFRANITLMNSNLLRSWSENMISSYKSRIPETSPENQDNNEGEEGKQDRPDLKDKPDSQSDDMSEPDLKTETPPMDDQENPDEQYQAQNPPDSDADKKPGSTSSIPFQARIIGFLAQLKNISVSYQNSYVMNYTRKDDRPPFAFQIGIPHSVDSAFLDSKNNDSTISVTSGLTISRSIDSSINFSHSNNLRYASASNQSISTTFPDLTLTILDIDRWLGVSKYAANTRLNSGFQYTLRQTGDIDWIKPKQQTATISMNPLIGINTMIMNSVTTSINWTLSQSENTTDMETYTIYRNTLSHGINTNLSYSFREGRGFTIPFTGKKIHINNELTSALVVQYELNYDTTKGRETTQVDRDRARLNISPSATYQFDLNIRGGLTGGYEIVTDRKLDDGTRTFRLGIWVEFTL
ncbi:MAG: hypothetical protein FJ042_04190 [Candidatus Cloacimonetes bacterium]|nr:hypothetical protein [Candidatus Cloacimonadota bacterium]